MIYFSDIPSGKNPGRVMKLNPQTGTVSVHCADSGKSNGLMFDAKGRLIACCGAMFGRRALVEITPDGKLRPLVEKYKGKRLNSPNDLVVHPNGTIYFSDASHKFQITNFRAAVFEHQPNGRLLAYTPQGETKLLADNLYFANGVALAHDESYVLVAETTRYRIQRYWLTGERAGTLEMFVENLPGFPDGGSRGSAGRFWVAMFTIRNPIMDKVLPTPWIRKLLIRLPEALQPQAAPHGFVLGFDGDANVVANLQDRSADAFFPVTSVQERLGKLHLGSLQDNGIGRMAVP